MKKNQKEDSLWTKTIKWAADDLYIQGVVMAVLITLTGNVLHCIDKDIIGIIYARIMLIQTTMFFVPKEALRRACMRNLLKHSWPELLNFIWLMTSAITVCSCVLCSIWLGNWNLLELPPDKYLEDYQFAIRLFGVSCIIESFLEPVYILSMACHYFKWRDSLNFIEMLIKAGFILTAAICFPEHIIKSVAYGQLVSSIVLVVSFWVFFHLEFKKKAEVLKQGELDKDSSLARLPFSSIRELLPAQIISGPRFLNGQLLKENEEDLGEVILTEIFEIERYFVVGFSARNLAEKGIFETVQNLRFGLMEPAISALLSHCRLHIQQTIAPSNLLREQDHERIKQLSATFFKFFRCLGFMGYSIFLLGISYSLLMYGGSKLTDHPGPLLTKMECFIVFLVLILVAAYAYTEANPSYDLVRRREGVNIRTSFTCFIGCGLLSYHFGSFGFIVVTCCKLGFILFHSLFAIHRDFKELAENPLLGLLPTKREMLFLISALALTQWSQWFIYPYNSILHVTFGVAFVALILKPFMSAELQVELNLSPFITATLLAVLHLVF